VLLLSESANQTILIRKDVDNLVQNIKENLKLTQYESSTVQCPGLAPSLPDFSDYPTAVSESGQSFKARSRAFSSRPSPYGLATKNTKCDCIEGGGGPAVKRSSWAARKRYPSMSANTKPKLELEDPLEMLHELISEGNLLKEAVRRLQLGLSPKIQRNYYDSDEDTPRTPPPHLPNTFPDLCEIAIN